MVNVIFYHLTELGQAGMNGSDKGYELLEGIVVLCDSGGLEHIE
jgi:hypothetical protein